MRPRSGVRIGAVLVAALLATLVLVLSLSRVERARDEPESEFPAPPIPSSPPDPAQTADRAIVPLDDDPAQSSGEPPVREVAEKPPGAVVTLAGRVVDVERRPVPGAELFWLNRHEALRGTRVATTDENGSFRVAGQAHGRWSLRIASAEHPDRFERGLAHEPGAIVDGLEFVLAEGSEIRGRVVGAPDEVLESLWIRTVHVGWTVRPVEEPPLSPAPRWTRCAADGAFVVRGVESGSFVRLSAHDEQGESYQRPLTDVVEVRAGSQDVALAYQTPTVLLAQVVDARTLEPVTAFEVRIGGPDYVMPLLGADGRNQRDFPAGSVRVEIHLPQACSMLWIDAQGYAPLQVDVQPLERRELDLGTLRLEPAPMVEVRVLDGGTGMPVPRALVSLSEREESPTGSPWREQRTDEEGRARLNSFPGPNAVLRVRHDRYEAFENQISPDGGARQETVHLRPKAR